MKQPMSAAVSRFGLCVVLVLVLGAAGMTASAQEREGPLGIAMEAEEPVTDDQLSYVVSYVITIRNYGNEELSDLVLVTDLQDAFAGVTGFHVTRVEAERLVVNEGYDGAENVELLSPSTALPANAVEQILLELIVVPGDHRGPYETTAMASATAPGGATLMDLSQMGPDPDPDGNGNPGDNDQPTIVLLPTALIGISKKLVSERPNGDGSHTLVYELLVRNYGDVVLSAIQIEDDLSDAFAWPALCEVTAMTSRELSLNGNYDGSEDVLLLTGEDVLDVGEVATVKVTVCAFRQSRVSFYVNRASASGISPIGTLTTDTSEAGSDPDPDGDGDPRNNSRPTLVSFADFEIGGSFDTSVSLSELDGIGLDTIAMSSFLSIDGFTVQLQSSFRQTGMDTLMVGANGTFGDIRLNSSLIFDPSALSFSSFQGGAAATLFDLDITGLLFLLRPQTSSYTQVAISGSVDAFAAQATVRFAIYPFMFEAINTCATWEWPDCETAWNACLLFTGTGGFESFTVSVSELLVAEDVYGVEALLDAVVFFRLEDKIIAPTLRLVPEWEICTEIEVLGEISTSASPLSAIATLIYGIVGEIEFDNDMTFTIAESFSAAKNASVTGNSSYSGAIKVEGPLASCCDEAGAFELAAYFGAGFPATSSSILSIGLVTASFDYQMFEGLGMVLEASYPVGGSPWSLKMKIQALW